MGGGEINPTVTDKTEEDSFLDQESSQFSSPLNSGSEMSMADDDGAVDEDSQSGSVYGDCGRRRDWEANERMREHVYREITDTDLFKTLRGQYTKESKEKILSYKPGEWIETAGSMKKRDYDVPKMTTLLLVGPKGSGKSSLINRISKVLKDETFETERAQVSYNSSVGDGTLFLHEYMMPRGSNSFCIYDTRSMSDDSAENIKMLKKWVVNGVRHGEPAIRNSDDESLRTAMMHKAHGNVDLSSAVRKVNFVILVVNGLSVLEAMESEEDDKTQYTQMIASLFNRPFLSFKDDKPAVVVTHGDLLSPDERARVRIHLGELLGIPPTTQIFDIPERRDLVTESTTVEMLRYSLEHAEKNYSHKKKAPTRWLLPIMDVLLTLMLLGYVITSWGMYHPAHIQQPPSSPSASQHCHCPKVDIEHCSFLNAEIQHDHGPFPGEYNQNEPLLEEHIEKEPLLEEHIQQDPVPHDHILRDSHEQVQEDGLPQEPVQHDSDDTLPQEHVQQVPLLQEKVRQESSPREEKLSPPSSTRTPHFGPLPRVQAEVKKIISKVVKFKKQLNWRKFRGLYMDEESEPSEVIIDWKKIRGLYLDQ